MKMDIVCKVCTHRKNGKCNLFIDGKGIEYWCKPELRT